MVAKKQKEDAPKREFRAHYRAMEITEISRGLRKRSTKSEDLLWQALRRKQLGGLKFRRQHPFGPSIVDFYCHEKCLVVEIDGAAHLTKDAKERDKIRQEIIEGYGVRFLRLSADEVERDLKVALAKIKEAADETPHPSVPSP